MIFYALAYIVEVTIHEIKQNKFQHPSRRSTRLRNCHPSWWVWSKHEVTIMKLARHHINPLLREYDRARYDSFFNGDYVLLTNKEHTAFHLMLRYDKEYQKIKSEIIDYIDNYCGIFRFDQDPVVRNFENYCRAKLEKFLHTRRFDDVRSVA